MNRDVIISSNIIAHFNVSVTDNTIILFKVNAPDKLYGCNIMLCY